MKSKKLLATKVGPEFHEQSHKAAATLNTTVSAEIMRALRRMIKRAEKKEPKA